MLFTQEAVDTLLVLKIDVAQNAIPFDDFIKNVEIERQLVDRLDLLDELPANRTANSKVMVESEKTLRAKSVATMDEYPRNSLSYIKFVTAEVAEVETPALVVSLY